MKKLIIVLAAAVLLAMSAPADAGYITDASGLRGSDYTDIPALARGLDQVFAGAVKMYRDIRYTVPASAPVGSRSVPLGLTYYVRSPGGDVYSGTSCYIYANAVYATLFGDVPYHGQPGTWENSRRVGGNMDSASFESFRGLGVGCGALLRTTARSDGSYDGSAGHSLIVLKYDEDSITYLEGNADGAGLIRVTKLTWSGFNSSQLSGRGRKISFIVQPTKEHYSAMAGEDQRTPDLVGRLAAVRSCDGRFSDVPADSWFCSGVELTYALGIAEGRGSDRFDPNGTVNAAEAVTFCARFLSLLRGDGWDFSRPGGPWYVGYYDYCDLFGIDTGFAGPFDVITRGQFVMLMSAALPEEYRGEINAKASFADVSPGAAFYRAVRSLARCGIIAGSGGLLLPDQGLTRAEAASFLARMADRSLRIGAA